jgi:hypothetical protein
MLNSQDGHLQSVLNTVYIYTYHICINNNTYLYINIHTSWSYDEGGYDVGGGGGHA